MCTLITFLTAVTTHLTGTTQGREGLFWSTVREHSPLWQDQKIAMYCISSQETGMNPNVQLTFIVKLGATTCVPCQVQPPILNKPINSAKQKKKIFVFNVAMFKRRKKSSSELTCSSPSSGPRNEIKV